MPYQTLTPTTLRPWLNTQPDLTFRLGGTPEDWAIQEVSDGNLNTVFIVTGPDGSLCCKQALPHVRVAPDWPMPLERALYEARYMRETTHAIKPAAPELVLYDDDMFLLVMENLTPHTVLRSALIANTVQSGFSATIGRAIARTAHATSWISQPFEHGAHLLEQFSGNTALTRITVDLILTDPYHPCDRNPEPEAALRPVITTLQSNATLHEQIGHLQNRFLTAREALLHGDLHTGSIMLHGPDIRIIDGEFATIGPIGFDCGLYLGNLALHACAALEKAPTLLTEIKTFWTSFSTELQSRLEQGGGDVWSLSGKQQRQTQLNTFLSTILKDTAGFCGLEMIRRTIGFAQIADYTLCPTPEARTTARLRALTIGQSLILNHQEISSLDDVLKALTPQPDQSA